METMSKCIFALHVGCGCGPSDMQSICAMNLSGPMATKSLNRRVNGVKAPATTSSSGRTLWIASAAALTIRR